MAKTLPKKIGLPSLLLLVLLVMGVGATVLYLAKNNWEDGRVIAEKGRLLAGIGCAEAASNCTSLNVNQLATYYTTATDPDGDKLKIEFDWGDGKKTTTALKPSGESFSASHSWPAGGTYYIKVRSIDEKGASSAWSNSLKVSVSGSGGNGGGSEKLSTPKNVSCSASQYFGVYYRMNIRWGRVSNAEAYTVAEKKRGRYSTLGITSRTGFSFSCKKYRNYTMSVKASDRDQKYKDSNWSSAVTCLCR